MIVLTIEVTYWVLTQEYGGIVMKIKLQKPVIFQRVCILEKKRKIQEKCNAQSISYCSFYMRTNLPI